MFVFVLVFSGTGIVGLVLLRDSLLPTFERMESDVALEKAFRVISGFEQQMSSLSDLTHDWAGWDELYHHMQRPDPVFERSNLGTEAMQASKYHAALLLDQKNQVAGFGSRQLIDGRQAQPQDLAMPVVERLKRSPLQPSLIECGVARVAGALSALCWGGILRSNSSGPMIGTLVMAAELDAVTLKVIARNAGATFTLVPLGAPNTPASPALTWRLPALQYLTNKELPFQLFENSIAMHYLLHDLNEKPLTWVRIPTDRELMMQGHKVIQGVLQQLAALAAVTALVLLLAMHLWLVRPIAPLRNAVARISDAKLWDEQLVVDRPDEIGALAQGINSLLAVLRKQVDALEERSSTDALTGIANRRKFDERLDEELARLGRRTEPLSMLLLDVNHFKRYNDRYGHPQGDEVLRQIGVLLSASCRQQDLPARVGGEEFALILPDTDEAGTAAMANKILDSLAALAVEHDTFPTAPVVTISIGVATWPALQNGGATALYAQADQALYAAKAQGRKRACTYESLSAPSL